MNETEESPINPKRIEQTREVIAPYIRQTPVMTTAAADFGLNFRALHFKLELLQHSGSFKARGAFANLLMRNIPSIGVAAASGGNHGAAVAYAAMKLGVSAKIFVPTISSPAKVQRIRDYGAELVVEGERYADALAASERWITQSGALAVPRVRSNGDFAGTRNDWRRTQRANFRSRHLACRGRWWRSDRRHRGVVCRPDKDRRG